NADPILAKRLQDAGTATVMPLGSPIGSNRGLQTRDQIRIIIEQATVPVVVDAGLGAPSHAAEAMELGADAVLVNTAIAVADDPVRMAVAFKKAIEAGRDAHEIGLGAQLDTASATCCSTSSSGAASRAFRRKRRCRWLSLSAKASCPEAPPTWRAISPL